MKHKLTILIFFVLAFTSCKKDDFVVDNDTIQVTIKNSNTYTYSTGIGGDEEVAKIIIQANNYEISELRRNQSTDWVVFYDYKPKSNFTGKEYIEIETYDAFNPPATSKIIKILITITE